MCTTNRKCSGKPSVAGRSSRVQNLRTSRAFDIEICCAFYDNGQDMTIHCEEQNVQRV